MNHPTKTGTVTDQENTIETIESLGGTRVQKRREVKLNKVLKNILRKRRKMKGTAIDLKGVTVIS